jgi:hypothetical protein
LTNFPNVLIYGKSLESSLSEWHHFEGEGSHIFLHHNGNLL